MAYTATVDIDVRTTGSDSNSGGFDIASSGTDYSQQDFAQVAFIDLVIDASTNTNCTSAANPFTSAHVGNTINITGGTGFTTQSVLILSVASGVATCDKSLGTLGSTGGTGNLGGAKKTTGGAGALPIVAGNRIWIKYHASNAYVSTSTTNNVANGKLSISVGSATAPVLIRGYDAAHGDNTGNRPTLRWGVNASSNMLVTLNNAGNYVENILFDCNRANFTSTRGLSITNTQQAVLGCKFTGASAGAMFCSSAVSAADVTGCEFTDCVTTACVTVNQSGTVNFYGCYFHDNTVTGISNSSTGNVSATRSIFDTCNVGAALTSTGKLTTYECVFYNQTSHGVDVQNSGGQASLINCIFENNGGYGVSTSAGTFGAVRMQTCAFYNNTSGKYDSARVLAQSVAGEIVNTTGTFFVDADNGDFKLNNTPNQGALVRAAGYPLTHPGGAANFTDVGAQQHQDSGNGAGPIIGPGRLVRA